MMGGYCLFCGCWLPDLMSPAASIVYDAHRLACNRWGPPSEVDDPESPISIYRL